MKHSVARTGLCTLVIAAALLLGGGMSGAPAADESKDMESAIEQGDTEKVAALLKEKPWLAKRPHKVLV